MGEKDYYLGFSSFSGIGPIKFKIVLAKFGTAKDAWEATKSDLGKVVGEKLAIKFDEFRRKFSIADYISQLEKKDVYFVTLTEGNYPKLLKQIKNPPFVLYVKGNIEILKQVQDDNERTIAVVGTRRTTSYGREVTTILTQDLVLAGFTIVSGLAIGVDAISHRTAIENGGKTIAVLGCELIAVIQGRIWLFMMAYSKAEDV